MTISRQLITVAVEYGKALSLLDEKQETSRVRYEVIMAHAEAAIRPLIQQYLEDCLLGYGANH